MRVYASIILAILISYPAGAQSRPALQLDGFTRFDLPGPGIIAHLPEKTVTAWVRLPVGPRLPVNLFCEGSSTGWPLLQLVIDEEGTLAAASHNGPWDDFRAPVGIVPSGQWHHVAVRMNSDTSQMFFVDGRPVRTERADAASFLVRGGPTPTASVMTGGTCSGATHTDNFVGEIADIRAYGRSLSDGEVLAMASNSTIPVTDLLGHWPLQGDLRDLALGRDAVACGPLAWSSAMLPPPLSDGHLTVSEDPLQGLHIHVDAPNNPGAQLLLWMSDLRSETVIGDYQSQLALSSVSSGALITLSDPYRIFGLPAAPTSNLDANGQWDLRFPTNFLPIFFPAAPEVYFEATLVKPSLFPQRNAIRVLPLQTFSVPAI